MKDILNQKVGTAFGIAVVCLFCSIYYSIGYQVVDNYLCRTNALGERLLVRR